METLNTELEKRVEERTLEIRSANELLKSMASRDYLTGLYNHRVFRERIAEQLSIARRYDTPFSLLIIDLDHFKNVNDRFGHQAGDSVLRTVGDALRKALRSTDIPCRYGGEEFAVILPHVEKEGACILAKRLVTLLGNIDYESIDAELSVTASIGACAWARDTESGMDVEELIKTADTMLYQAKNQGRNQAVIFEDD